MGLGSDFLLMKSEPFYITFNQVFSKVSQVVTSKQITIVIDIV
jgi:hypothetical protein